MAPVGKTKTQAQKKAGHEQKILQKAEEARLEKLARAAALKEEVAQKLSLQANEAAANKKELRKAKKEAKRAPAPLTPAATRVEPRSCEPTPPSCSLSDIVADTPAPPSSSGRLTSNHTSYIEELKPVLVRLLKRQAAITRVTAGVISSVSSLEEQLTLRVQRQTETCRFKVVARNGHQVQDVDVVVSTPVFDQEALQHALDGAIESRVKVAAAAEVGLLPMADYNRLSKQAADSSWRETHQASVEEQKAVDKSKREEAAQKAELSKLRRISRKDKEKIPGLVNKAVM